MEACHAPRLSEPQLQGALERALSQLERLPQPTRQVLAVDPIGGELERERRIVQLPCELQRPAVPIEHLLRAVVEAPVGAEGVEEDGVRARASP